MAAGDTDGQDQDRDEAEAVLGEEQAFEWGHG
jgi:hypothetical protein